MNEIGAEVEDGIPETASAPIFKTCNYCGVEKNIVCFKQTVSHGKPYVRAECTVCINKKAAEREHLKRRAEGIPLMSETKRPWIHKGMKYNGPHALDAEGFRNCTECDQKKHKSEFYANKRRHGGIGTICKSCSAIKSKKYEQEHDRSKDPKRLAQLRRNYISKYGISVEQFNEMLIAQDGGCAICGRKQPGGRGTFHVDHDHQTNKVRGLLCVNCNLGIGNMHDDPGLLRIAIRYLERSVAD